MKSPINKAELKPSKLGGIRSGEKRAGPRAFRAVFGG